MRQENTSGYVKHVMVWPPEDSDGDEPFLVGPGETVDRPELLAGFTAVPDPAEPAPAIAKPARKPAAPEPPAATDEGGEPA